MKERTSTIGIGIALMVFLGALLCATYYYDSNMIVRCGEVISKDQAIINAGKNLPSYQINVVLIKYSNGVETKDLPTADYNRAVKGEQFCLTSKDNDLGSIIFIIWMLFFICTSLYVLSIFIKE